MSFSPLGRLGARLGVAGALAAAAVACTSTMMSSSGGAGASAASPSAIASQGRNIAPAGEANARTRLNRSTRHGEFAMIRTGPNDSVNAYVVYPERTTKAPVVVVVHEIYGLSTWIQNVADQLAADGFIAIAPDMITGSGLQTDSALRAGGPALIRALKREDVQRRISAVANYGMSLPAALKKYGVVGYCWGGGTVFTHAADAPNLGAAVVYYGPSPAKEDLAKISAPVLGFYGEADARITAAVPATDTAMKALGKSYQYEIFRGAAHGFLRQHDDLQGPNYEASKAAWPRTIAFFRETLER